MMANSKDRNNAGARCWATLRGSGMCILFGKNGGICWKIIKCIPGLNGLLGYEQGWIVQEESPKENCDEYFNGKGNSN